MFLPDENNTYPNGGRTVVLLFVCLKLLFLMRMATVFEAVVPKTVRKHGEAV